MKTARFAELVKKAGAPRAYLPWISPKKDPAFQRALKAHRVLTVYQNNVGTRKDYAVVGFDAKPQAQFFVFPKSLRSFAGRRIVGVNYALLAEEDRPGPAPAATPPKPRTAKSTAGG